MTDYLGHGHVKPRPDGAKARCGGPGICSECAREAFQAPESPVATGELQEVSPRHLTFGNVPVLHTVIPVAYGDPQNDYKTTLAPEPMCYEHGPQCPVSVAAKQIELAKWPV